MRVEAQQQQPAGGGKEKKKGTPCLICGALCDTPVCDLFLDVALLKQLEGATALAVPTCDACDDAQATKHCGDCKKNVAVPILECSYTLARLYIGFYYF